MITLSILILLYFLPTILAAHRGHHPITGILLLNLFFGWTGVVWFSLLLWALLSTPRYILVAPAQYAAYPYYRRY